MRSNLNLKETENNSMDISKAKHCSINRAEDEKVCINSLLPFIFMHAACLGVFFVSWSYLALGICIALYVVRMFGITAGYHRYFAHRSFKTSRVFQFLLGVLGATAAQRGPLWWAAHHRHHHRHSDEPEDIHSPRQKGFWWAHMGWILCPKYDDFNPAAIRDMSKYREIRLLDKFHFIAPITLAFVLFCAGELLLVHAPKLNASGPQFLFWGFFLSTTLLYHGTFFINSLAHVIGKKRYNTKDDSKNSLFLALVTLGEGWHNNHHFYPGSERQGFYWWEIDISHYTLKFLSKLGLVWELRSPPKEIL